MASAQTRPTNQIIFKSKTKKQVHLKWLCCFLSILVFIMGIGFIALVLTYNTQKICLSAGCIKAASNAIKHLNTAVNPCEDFYEFVCGNFIKETVIPEDEVGVNVFTKIQATVQSQLMSIVQDPLLNNASKPYQYLRKLYKLCMNVTEIEREGLKFAKQLLKDFGGWPLLEGSNWNETNFDWIQLLHNLRKNGLKYNYFVKISVDPDMKNSSRRMITLDQMYVNSHELILPISKNTSVRGPYFNYILSVATSFGANKSVAEADIKEIVEFEQRFTQIVTPPDQRRNYTNLYNPMSIEELQKKLPTIDWLRYINSVINIPNIVIDKSELVAVIEPEYFYSLSELLRKTPKRVQANYILAKTVLSIVPYLTRELIHNEEIFYSSLEGGFFRNNRWKECLEIVSENLRLPLASLYVKRYFNKESKRKAELLTQNIKLEFIKLLKRVDWLDKNTKKHALEKASAISSHVGYPTELIDDKNIEDYYIKLEMNTTHFLRALMNISVFNEDYEFSQYRNIFNKSDWIQHAIFATEINAFYCVEENSIQFPAAILQDEVFDSSRPNYVNYATLGYVIGHEITHGFDDQGRQFDKDGNLNEWWNPDTEAAFIRKAQCIVNQYDNYTAPDVNIHLNGVNTQGENIADNGGIKVAYLAFKQWEKKQEFELLLPGLNYTPQQMFWISAAQLWCHKTRVEISRQMALYDEHAPPRFRVIGPFSNSEYFAKDFNCKTNSFMNPKNKCSVW